MLGSISSGSSVSILPVTTVQPPRNNSGDENNGYHTSDNNGNNARVVIRSETGGTRGSRNSIISASCYWLCCCCKRPEITDDDNSCFNTNSVYFFQNIYDLFSPRQGVEYDIILLPIFVSLLVSVFFIDLAISGAICGDYNNICDSVYTLSWWSGLYRPTFLQGNNYLSIFTYSLHHLNVGHISTNLIMTCYPLYYLEKKYGSARMLVLTIITAAGGGLFALWFYSDRVAVGFSGVIYGYLATSIADATLNFETIKSKVWSVILVLTMVLSILLEQFMFTGFASWSHIGGGISGLWFGFLILPNFHVRKWEWCLPVLAVIAIILQFVILPCILFNVIKT